MAERRERSDISLRGILAGVGVIAGGIAIAIVAPWLVIAHASAPDYAPNDAARPALRAPRQETAPLADVAAFRREKERRLESADYDAATGEAHIPIERAMAMLAAGAGPSAVRGGAAR